MGIFHDSFPQPLRLLLPGYGSESVYFYCLSHQGFRIFWGSTQTVKIDNLKAGVVLPSFYEPLIQQQYSEFLAYYQSAPITARVRRPEDKGKG